MSSSSSSPPKNDNDSNETKPADMADLAPLVAAVLRDQVIADLQAQISHRDNEIETMCNVFLEYAEHLLPNALRNPNVGTQELIFTRMRIDEIFEQVHEIRDALQARRDALENNNVDRIGENNQDD